MIVQRRSIPFALAVLLLAGACAAQKPVETPAEDPGAGSAAEIEGYLRDEPVEPEPVPETTPQDLLAAEDITGTGSLGEGYTIAGLENVYFDFDSSTLPSDMRSALEDNVRYLEQNPGLLVQIEGHCDERGTEEYNLALGQRRAESVREYMVRRGIDPARLTTISYGEERPADPGHDETAWAQNRRVTFVIR